jgi:ComF family protein
LAGGKSLEIGVDLFRFGVELEWIVVVFRMAFFSRMLQRAQDWGACALDLAFPWPESEAPEACPIERPFCERCGFPYPALKEEAAPFTCSPCAGQTWYFSWARAAYRTEGRVHEAIVGFKYNDQHYQYGPLVDWLTEAFDAHAGGQTWDALVPVPLYHRRKRDRGFNQAKELARGLGRKRKLPVWDCLHRDRETPSQTGLNRTARRENVAGAFRWKPRFDVRARNLLLIDDVFTTGATTNACAHALIKAGAGQIAVLTVARS